MASSMRWHPLLISRCLSVSLKSPGKICYLCDLIVMDRWIMTFTKCLSIGVIFIWTIETSIEKLSKNLFDPMVMTLKSIETYQFKIMV